VEEISLALATALFAGHFAAEPLLRRGRAKSLATTPFERKSTLLVTAVGLASVVASFAARFGLEWGRLAPHPGRVSVLGLVMLAGVALRYWSMLSLGEFFTRTLAVMPDQDLVSAGPYRVVRHPGYLAQLVVLTAGCALASLNVWLPALIGPLLLAAYVYRIQAEERMLASEFGETYQRYRSRTWRLIPGVY
jgi:protein-S-isoprenylcysteine O-methyltransferase Ste14